MSTLDTPYHYPSTWKQSGILQEVTFKASLSGGKGGQHTNKVSTKMELYWTPSNSSILREEHINKVLSKLSNKLSHEGTLRLVCEEERSQLKNKEKVIEKFYKLLADCFKIKKARKNTKPTKASITKRLTSKTKRKEIKQSRKRLDE